MSFKITQEVLAIYQSEEVSISSKRDLVPWLYDVLKKHLYGGQKNWDSYVMASAPVNMRHLTLPQIYQLLLTIYPEI